MNERNQADLRKRLEERRSEDDEIAVQRREASIYREKSEGTAETIISKP